MQRVSWVAKKGTRTCGSPGTHTRTNTHTRTARTCQPLTHMRTPGFLPCRTPPVQAQRTPQPPQLPAVLACRLRAPRVAARPAGAVGAAAERSCVPRRPGGMARARSGDQGAAARHGPSALAAQCKPAAGARPHVA